MLRLLVYDICDAKRLRRVATICEDYGMRIQDSVFECWLDEEGFGQMWAKLDGVMENDCDKIAVYKLDSKAARQRIGAGATMAFSQKPGAGIFL